MPATVNSQLKMTFHQPQILKPNQFWTSLKQKGGIRAKIDQWFSKHILNIVGRKKSIKNKSSEKCGLVSEWMLRPQHFEHGNRIAEGGIVK